MKTLNENKNWGVELRTTSVPSTRPKIGDDDGISNRTMNLVIVLFTLLTLGISFAASAQQADSLENRILLRQAMLDMERENYEKAVIKLLEVRASTPENANVNQMLGKCFLIGLKENDKAIFYLSRAVSQISTEFEDWDMDETRAPLETAYYLAQAYETQGDMAKAAECYETFLMAAQNDPMSRSRTYAMIRQNAERCKGVGTGQSLELNESMVLNNN